MTAVKLKDPESEFDYQIDWSPWLGDDTISTSTWSVDPTGELTIVVDNHDDNQTSVQVSGGVRKSTYRLTNQIVSSGGNTVERTITVRVGDR